MSKLITFVILTLLMVGCVKNPQLKAVINDLESTPRCDTKPVLTQPNDIKETLNAKLLITNYKIACIKDWYFYFDKKLESYKKL